MRMELFSDVCVWFCVYRYVNVPKCKCKIDLFSGKSFHFLVPRRLWPLYCFWCAPWTPKSIHFQICGTYTSSWTSNFVLNLSKCCKNLAPWDGFSFAIFVTVTWEFSARGGCAWLTTVLQAHELGISLDHHPKTSFVVSLHSLGLSGGRKFEWKKHSHENPKKATSKNSIQLKIARTIGF